jgi:hypothetical protein
VLKEEEKNKRPMAFLQTVDKVPIKKWVLFYYEF